MKKKKRKHGKVRLRARRSAWAVRARQRGSPRKQGAESKSLQWLRMIPFGVDNFDVYIPEAK